jgi:hypothetical protein
MHTVSGAVQLALIGLLVLSCSRSRSQDDTAGSAAADSCWALDSLAFSDVVGDSETGDSSGFEIVLIRRAGLWSGWYREAAGEYGPSAPLVDLVVDRGSRRVSFSMPAGSDSSLFEGTLWCDSLVGQFRGFRTVPFEQMTFKRRR